MRSVGFAIVGAAFLGLINPSPLIAGTIEQSQRPSVAPILRAITPAVVNISSRKVETVNSPVLRDPALRELLDIPEGALRREMRAGGSGVIVDAANGYILTNDHVVRGAS